MRTIAGRVVTLATPMLIAAALCGNAQPPSPKLVKASVSGPKSVPAGKAFTLTVAVSIDSHYHIQGNPAPKDYIATELEVGPAKGFKLDKVTYPKAVVKLVAGEKLPVYEGAIQIKAEVSADHAVRPGKYVLPVSLRYPGCDDQKCFPPTAVAMKAAVTVTGGK